MKRSAFIYIWRDKIRGMYYVGSHVGNPDDGYLSSSSWLNGEIRFRPGDFRRKVIFYGSPKSIRLKEHSILSKIKDDEYGKRYYNLKQGKKKGTPTWNKGRPMSEEHRQNLKNSLRGRTAWNKGKPNTVSAQNGKKAAEKLSKLVTGRKMVTVESKRTWAYYDSNGWFIKRNGEKIPLDFSPS